MSVHDGESVVTVEKVTVALAVACLLAWWVTFIVTGLEHRPTPTGHSGAPTDCPH
ncbi:hypothetical protein [Kitasatospora sp. NPDC093679]|uniref:hypothetical protein n=1 Tax=Kitasatospora sp. NPDC093679 TaxID=3154983 RepID=UPI00342BF6D2